MSPPETKLGPARNVAAGIEQRERQRTGRYYRPPLTHQRRPAWREKRNPDEIECIGAELRNGSHASDGQELGVEHIQEVAGRKPIGRRDDVRFSPSDELLTDIDRQRSAADRPADAPN